MVSILDERGNNRMQKQIKEKIEVLCNFFEKPINIILAFISLTVVITSTTKYLYSSWYIIKCQEFYKIPAKYFKQIKAEKVFSDLLPIGIVLVVMIILTLVSIKIEKRSDNTSKIIFYAVNIILGIVVICIIYDNLMNITLETLKRHMNIEIVSSHVSVIPIVFLFVATFLGCGLIFSYFFKKRLPKLKWVHAVLILITVGIIFISAFYSLPIAPQDKSQYEVTFISDETGDENSLGDNRVVLSEIDGNFLTVSYELDKESDAVIFYTQSYKILPMEGLELWMKRFNSGIKIDSTVVID